MRRQLVILFLLGLLAGFVISHCPDNWVQFQGQCYFFAHDYKTFTEAEHFCLQRGAHLAHAYTEHENLFLVNMCKDLIKSAHWIGLTDVVVDGIWKWKHTDEVANYTDWYPGQPDQGKSANCVVIWPDHNFHWGDISCDYHGGQPICQKPLPASCETDEVGIVG